MKRLILLLVFGIYAAAAPITVQHREGLVHGFLTLRNLQGELLANGDLIQNERGDRVTSRLVFHFKDGSVADETAVFSQRGTFRLISDHLIQKGPSFPHPVEMRINGRSGEVEVHYTEGNQEKTATDHVKNAADLANGMLLVLLKNVPGTDSDTRLSYVVATPKPRVVAFVASVVDEDEFKTGDEGRKAKVYRLKVDLGGVTGVLASIFGKNPPDQRIWILPGEAPAFVKSEGQLAPDGPIWRIELASPTWKSEK
ncbi:MAG TPA: hypothetical protein VGL89_07820 [Candidatus Koribacter sp.]